jgi:hypothetical protein
MTKVYFWLRFKKFASREIFEIQGYSVIGLYAAYSIITATVRTEERWVESGINQTIMPLHTIAYVLRSV